MMYGLHEKYDGNAVCTVVCMSRKKKFQIHRPPQFFSIDLLSKKKNPDAAYGGTKICSD